MLSLLKWLCFKYHFVLHICLLQGWVYLCYSATWILQIFWMLHRNLVHLRAWHWIFLCSKKAICCHLIIHNGIFARHFNNVNLCWRFNLIHQWDWVLSFVYYNRMHNILQAIVHVYSPWLTTDKRSIDQNLLLSITFVALLLCCLFILRH